MKKIIFILVLWLGTFTSTYSNNTDKKDVTIEQSYLGPIDPMNVDW